MQRRHQTPKYTVITYNVRAKEAVRDLKKISSNGSSWMHGCPRYTIATENCLKIQLERAKRLMYYFLRIQYRTRVSTLFRKKMKCNRELSRHDLASQPLCKLSLEGQKEQKMKGTVN